VARKKESQAGSTQRLVVVGAGPKAAALAAKARVLKELGFPEVKIDVLEREKEIAANWIGLTGFTTGMVQLCTPPEKDVGFPYTSLYGSEVDKRMLVEYSWHAYKILFDKSLYSDWVDTGREHPTHLEWARYLKAILMPEPGPKSDIVRQAIARDDVVRVISDTSVTLVEPEDGQVKITALCKGVRKTFKADGIVLTGPGKPITIDDMPEDGAGLIFNGQDYWKSTDTFRQMKAGSVAVIGGGETAASIVLSLLEITQGSSLQIDIINRHGAIFSRGESYNESRRFSSPKGWLDLDLPQREELIKRTDRGVFSLTAQRRLNKARNIDYKSGEVLALRIEGDKVVLSLRRGNPSVERQESYDRAIVALGFNPWTSLELLPQQYRPLAANPKELMGQYRELEKTIDANLCLPFDFVPSLKGKRFNVHLPVVAGLAQGPGFPSLCSLGHLSDRILSRYIDPPKPSR
jgi:mycobactin lysine-N-oxygenase